jgi:hypothetical protein
MEQDDPHGSEIDPVKAKQNLNKAVASVLTLEVNVESSIPDSNRPALLVEGGIGRVRSSLRSET